MSHEGWIVFAASVSVAVNLFLIGAFVYHRSTIANYKAALVQWQRWGVQMRRNLGWTDSYLRTRVKNMTLNTRTKVWKQDAAPSATSPQERPPLPATAKTSNPSKPPGVPPKS